MTGTVLRRLSYLLLPLAALCFLAGSSPAWAGPIPQPPLTLSVSQNTITASPGQTVRQQVGIQYTASTKPGFSISTATLMPGVNGSLGCSPAPDKDWKLRTISATPVSARHGHGTLYVMAVTVPQHLGAGEHLLGIAVANSTSGQRLYTCNYLRFVIPGKVNPVITVSVPRNWSADTNIDGQMLIQGPGGVAMNSTALGGEKLMLPGASRSIKATVQHTWWGKSTATVRYSYSDGGTEVTGSKVFHAWRFSLADGAIVSVLVLVLAGAGATWFVRSRRA